jgi:DNA-binding IclR family transcriptional regulator
VPLIAPLASAWIAWSSDREVRRWMTAGNARRSEQRRLREILEVVRERGYSVALEVEGRRRIGEMLTALAEDPHSEPLRRGLYSLIAELGHGPYQLGKGPGRSFLIHSITAPVFQGDGQVALSITVQGFDRRLSRKGVRDTGAQLLEVTESIAQVVR